MKRIGNLLVAIILLMGLSATAQTVNVDSLKRELKHEIITHSKEVREIQKDSMILSKLNPDQLMQLKKQELEVKRQQVLNEGNEEMPLNGAGIVLISLLPFLFVVAIVYISARSRNNESQRRYDIYMKSIEMGQTVPEHFFEKPEKVKTPSSNLQRGIICLAVGLAILVCYIFLHSSGFLIGGIIPAFIGIGYLIVYSIEKPRTDSNYTNEQNG